MEIYYMLTEWYDDADPYAAAYYTVAMLGEDHPRYVNASYTACYCWASKRATHVEDPGERRLDSEDYLLSDMYNDAGKVDGMAYEVKAVFRIEG